MIFSCLILILSTTGIQTNKFSKIISNSIKLSSYLSFDACRLDGQVVEWLRRGLQFLAVLLVNFF